ncbi:hypothetical protein VMCG_02147 [Cytospora schulzeri]|uniref:Uncharacterized protein n=1 Tax=Cytospora schulzeri TaxID=448051 RepID=A0A423X206_9PEZI|nr:hypothetical protein VMCG_02147 [Valsa malicola]
MNVSMFLAGGWGVAVSDAITNNILLQKLPQYVPGIDPQAVLAVGAAGIEDVYHGDELIGVRKAYLDANGTDEGDAASGHGDQHTVSVKVAVMLYRDAQDLLVMSL